MGWVARFTSALSAEEAWGRQTLAPKAVRDQCGRDARQLCMRAAGQGALVVHWDGRHDNWWQAPAEVRHL